MVFMICINLFPSTNQNVPLCIYTRPFHLVYQPQQHLEMKKERRKPDICHETPDLLRYFSKLINQLPIILYEHHQFSFYNNIIYIFPYLNISRLRICNRRAVDSEILNRDSINDPIPVKALDN